MNLNGSATPVETAVTVIEPGFPAWDVNRDGKTDIADLALVGMHLGETITIPQDQNPDVNRDGVVDIFDLVIVATHLDKAI